MFEKITAFLPELNKSSYGSVGFHENDDHITFVAADYDHLVQQIVNAIYETVDQNPELDTIGLYNGVLEKNQGESLADAMNNLDVSHLDGRTVLLFLFAATRQERFCEGALLEYFNDGRIRLWIQRLKDIDEAQNASKEGAQHGN